MNRQAYTTALGDSLTVTLELEPPKFGLAPEDLFALAMRRNPNRPFLFVSKVLGKHLPIRPAVLPAAGKLLSLALEGANEPGPWAGIIKGAGARPFPALMDELERTQIVLGPEERTLFVGFAETATGLGQAVAACYAGESAYLSTTRFPLEGMFTLTFDESHSHAKTQLLHFAYGGRFPSQCSRAVIIDDEFTTGDTALKLVEVLHRQFQIKRFVLLSILDWSGGASRQTLADRLGVEIQAVSLLRGAIQQVEQGPVPQTALEDLRGAGCPNAGFYAILDGPPRPTSGRTLLSAQEQAEQRRSCAQLAKLLGSRGDDALFLGTGEFIYAPALIAGYCGAAAFHSTTQSPIYPLAGSAVTCGACFEPPDRYSPAGYLYEIPRGRYRQAVILVESAALPHSIKGISQLAHWLRGRGCEHVEVTPL